MLAEKTLRALKINLYSYLICLILACPLMVRGDSPVLHLSGMDQSYTTLGYLDYWVADRDLQPEQVASLSAAGTIDFTPLTETLVPRRDRDIWLRLKILNNSRADNHVHLNFHDFIYKKVAVYQKDANGQWFGKETGINYPYSQREVDYRHFAFGISLQKNEIKEILILVNSMYQRRFMPIIQPDAFFFKDSINNTMFSAIILGIVIGTFIYMLIAGGFSRSRHFISLYLFLLLALLNMLYYSGFMYQLMPDQVKIHQGLAIVLNATLIYTGVQLARVLFEFDKNYPLIRYLVWIYTLVVLIIIHVAMLDLPETVYVINDYYLVPIGILVMLCAGIYGLFQGNRYAVVYVIGVSFYLVINAFFYSFVISSTVFRWDIHVYEFATCLMVLFLASTVILRIRFDRKQLEMAERNAPLL